MSDVSDVSLAPSGSPPPFAPFRMPVTVCDVSAFRFACFVFLYYYTIYNIVVVCGTIVYNGTYFRVGVKKYYASRTLMCVYLHIVKIL